MRRLALVLALVSIGAVAAAGLVYWRVASGTKAAKPTPPVPVEVVAATQKDVPIFLRGLGVARGFNVVSITSRVEGNITKINFKEGQFVHEGDTLIELDPRPYQAALDQAKATLARERAFEALVRGYERVLHFSLRHRAAVMTLNLVLIGVSGWLFIVSPKGFFPQEDTGLIFGFS